MHYADSQVLTVDESRVYSPPSKLQVPDTPISNSDSALSAPDSEADSSASSSPVYAEEPERPRPDPSNPEHVAMARQVSVVLYSAEIWTFIVRSFINDNILVFLQCEGEHFRYDNVAGTPGRSGSPLSHSGRAVETYPQEYSPRRLQQSPVARWVILAL